MSASQKTLFVVAGPTAVGKTSAAIELAQYLNTEIISADSRQCYHEMPVGTAQPNAEERRKIKHHFVDCFDPEITLSAADFERFALQKLEEIFKEKNTAVVCGGTGLYIKALCEGLDEMPAVNERINEEINQQYAEKGIAWLQENLRFTDPDFFIDGEAENPARMLRALVFHLSNGKSISSFRTGIKKERPFQIIKIGLELPREILYNRINLRVDEMLTNGLVEEAKNLYPKRHLKSLNTVGYTELFYYFDEQISLATAVDKIKQHSRNYSKRQLTWFKKDPAFHWFQANDVQLLEKIIDLK